MFLLEKNIKIAKDISIYTSRLIFRCGLGHARNPKVCAKECSFLTGNFAMSEAAIDFLKDHGHQSLISLGCGNILNRLGNYVKLFVSCGVEYYVGSDRVTKI